MKLIASVKEHVFYLVYGSASVCCVYWVFLRDVRDVFWASFSCSWKRQIKASFYVPCSFSSIISEPKGKYLMTPLISCLTSSPQVMHLKRSLTMDIKLVGISQYGHTHSKDNRTSTMSPIWGIQGSHASSCNVCSIGYGPPSRKISRRNRVVKSCKSITIKFHRMPMLLLYGGRLLLDLAEPSFRFSHQVETNIQMA